MVVPPPTSLSVSVETKANHLEALNSRSVSKDSCTPLRTCDEISPQWLTACLTAHGFLYSGSITHVHNTTSHKTQSSKIWHISVTYSDDTPQSAPRKLVLKVSNPQRTKINAREVEFYTHIAPKMLNPPILRCFDAVYSLQSDSYHVLLEDLSDSHCVPEFPLSPTKIHAEMIIDALARLHSFWWDHPQLGHDVGEFPRIECIHRYVARAYSSFPILSDYLADRLSDSHRRIFEEAFAKHESLVQARLHRGTHFTFRHGDSHCWNFLLPKYPNGETVRIIDWYSFASTWRCWLGAADLASLMIPWWHPERRNELEQPLLRRYLSKIREYGIHSYSWEELWYDYRLSAISSLYIATNEVNRTSPTLWLPQLERALTAVRDLRSLEL